MTDVPKAELHVHLEGTAPPDLIRVLAERNGLPVPEGVFAAPDRFAYTDFLDFLKTYDKAASVIRRGADYRDITYEYLMSCSAEGGVVAEVDVRAVGLAVVAMGGGRLRETDPVDHAVGLTEVAAPGEHVGPGERPLALVHAASAESGERAAQALREAYTLGEHDEVDHPIVLEVLR